MNRAQIADVIAKAAGSPSVGAVAEVIPAMADALDAALNGKTAKAAPAPEPIEE